MKRYLVEVNNDSFQWELKDNYNNLIVASFPCSTYTIVNLHRKSILNMKCIELNRKHDDDKLYLKEVKAYVASCIIKTYC